MHRFALAALLSLSVLRAAGGVPAPGDSIRQLRFSPDGRYILAQDSSEITILTVNPLAVLVRIPAENASNAHFTPDSNEVVFASSLLRPDSNPSRIRIAHCGYALTPAWNVGRSQTGPAETRPRSGVPPVERSRCHPTAALSRATILKGRCA